MKQEKINEILGQLESGYDQISGKFSQTRAHFWKEMDFVSNYIENGDKVLDYGCGNGRLIDMLKEKRVDYWGVDISGNLINLAQFKYPGQNFQKISSQSSLPSPDNYFNKIVSIAVFHHFPEEHAQKMAKELYRIIKPGGIVVITVWNLWQKRFWKYIFGCRVILGKIFQRGIYKGLGFSDIYIPFKDNNRQEYFNRYHRIYAKADIERIFSEAGFKKQRLEIIGGKNIIYVGKK